MHNEVGRCIRSKSATSASGWEVWSSKSRIRGVDDGSAYRVDRVDTLRNCVVPQVVEMIGNAAIEAMNAN